MKRYSIFASNEGSSQGGFSDYKGSFDTVKETEDWAEQRKNRFNTIQMVDMLTGNFQYL